MARPGTAADVPAAHLVDVMGFAPLALTLAAFAPAPLCYFGDACGAVGSLAPGRGIVDLKAVRAALGDDVRLAFNPWAGLSWTRSSRRCRRFERPLRLAKPRQAERPPGWFCRQSTDRKAVRVRYRAGLADGNSNFLGDESITGEGGRGNVIGPRGPTILRNRSSAAVAKDPWCSCSDRWCSCSDRWCSCSDRSCSDAAAATAADRSAATERRWRCASRRTSGTTAPAGPACSTPASHPPRSFRKQLAAPMIRHARIGCAFAAFLAVSIAFAYCPWT